MAPSAPPAPPPPSPQPKYQQVFESLRRDIAAGRWRPGERLPSEAELVRTFGASRITIGRALRDLQREGVIHRRAGSGTFLGAERPIGPAPQGALLFGLLIPDLGETEIFEPICQGLTASPLARPHGVIWSDVSGDGRRKEARAWELCRQYVERGVAGVFFAPLELTPEADAANRRILAAFDAVRLPVVLLDRGVHDGARRHDVVGIDNHRAGFVVTDHLLRAGARRVAFATLAQAARTVDARLGGYREALYEHGRPVEPDLVIRMAPGDREAIERLMRQGRPDGIVCANDRVAAHVMQVVLSLGYAIPGDVRLAGIDDVRYASLLPVPLTTLRQPCREIGVAAMAAMLERLARPDLPARDIFLETALVVRDSCGTRQA